METSIKACCGECSKTKEVHPRTLRRSTNKYGHYLCASCAAKKTPRPQCTASYWSLEKRLDMGKVLKESEKYYAAIQERPSIAGSANPMFGKKHNTSTKDKMSHSRRGKIGPNATAWKGGKTSLTRRVKGILHTRFGWYKKVYQRDDYKCVECGSKKKIDAHHKQPVWKLIRDMLKNSPTFDNEEEKLEWLVNTPELQDPELKNGITLCRICHQKSPQQLGKSCLLKTIRLATG